MPSNDTTASFQAEFLHLPEWGRDKRADKVTEHSYKLQSGY